MKSWRRQPTQCIFCAFRQATGPSRPTRGVREFSKTAIKALRIQKFGSPESRDSPLGKVLQGRKGAGSKRLDLALDRKPPRSRSGRFERTLDDFGDGQTQQERIISRLTAALGTLEKYLISLRKEKEKGHKNEGALAVQEVDIDKLDPKGTLFPAFRTNVLSLQRKVTASALTQREKDLWAELQAAHDKSRTELDKEIYFAFIDFCLKPSGPNMLKGIASTLDLRYPTEWYAGARTTQRVIHLHVGPTNSGKTYNALKRLQESGDGFYAGPLRLLAHEVYSRFRANGVSCDLVTGDDVRKDANPDTKVYASTVEMVNTSRECEVAVIDEIQMMASEDRGWAWTRAFLGANAKEVHLCGEERVVPLIREMAASMGDALKVHRYQRLNPLRCMSKSLRGNLKSLRKGDCIVAFSVMQLHALKKQIELETGKHCAIVYGSLPPETRAEQADLFNNPDNDYDFLVASDAVGMGLNLSIKRVIFNAANKFDGSRRVQLSIPQIKQIAGRAGRYRTAHDDKNKTTKAVSAVLPEEGENVGLVTCLDEADLPIIRQALQTEPPPLRKAGIIPPGEYLEEYSSQLPNGIPFEYIMRKVSQAATIHNRFFLCDIRDNLRIARQIDDIAGLTVEQRVNICACPASGNDSKQSACLKAITRAIAQNRLITVADVPEIPLEVLMETPKADRSYLESLELLHKCLIMYLWLSYRFQTVLRDQPMAFHAKGLAEQKINWTLRAFSANPKLRERLRKLKHTPDPVPEHEAATKTTEQQQREDDQAQELAGLEDDETLQEHFSEPDSVIAGAEGEQPGRLVSDQGLPSDAPSEHTNLDVVGHELEWEERTPSDEGDDVFSSPQEGKLAEESTIELKPDPADTDPTKPVAKGDIPTAKGQRAEFVNQHIGEVEEEVVQSRAASGSA